MVGCLIIGFWIVLMLVVLILIVFLWMGLIV